MRLRAMGISASSDAAATFYTNDDSLPDQLGNTPNYSGSQGELHIAVLHVLSESKVTAQ